MAAATGSSCGQDFYSDSESCSGCRCGCARRRSAETRTPHGLCLCLCLCRGTSQPCHRARATSHGHGRGTPGGLWGHPGPCDRPTHVGRLLCRGLAAGCERYLPDTTTISPTTLKAEAWLLHRSKYPEAGSDALPAAAACSGGGTVSGGRATRLPGCRVCRRGGRVEVRGSSLELGCGGREGCMPCFWRKYVIV